MSFFSIADPYLKEEKKYGSFYLNRIHIQLTELVYVKKDQFLQP